MVPVFMTHKSHQQQQQQQSEIHTKPTCSYTCLIGLALKSTKRQKMTVGDIYTYIRNRFPYYKTCASDTWKNSVRHSLSLSRNFRRIGVKGGEMKMKKGLEWEVIPERKEAVDREVELYEESVKKIGDIHLNAKPTADRGRSSHCSVLVMSPSPGQPNNMVCDRKGKFSQAMQHFSIDQCRNLAKMLASAGNSQLCPRSGGSCVVPPCNATGHSQAAKKCPRSLQRCKVEESRTTIMQSGTSHKRQGNLRDVPSTASKCELATSTASNDPNNCQYFDQLMRSVDRAIASQYGGSRSSQALSFGEISAALEKVERQFFIRNAATQLDKHSNKRERSFCKFCSAASKRAKLSDSSLFSTVDTSLLESSSISSFQSGSGKGSNSSFSLTSNPNSVVLNGGSKVGNPNRDLLLSKSEEKMLLRDLEHDARKASLNLFSYLKIAGEGISECFQQNALLVT